MHENQSIGEGGRETLRLTSASETGTQQTGKVTGCKIMLLLEAQGFCCAVSGMKLTPKTASLDHIVAVSKGGSRDMDNVQIVHEDVNRMKGTLSQERFIELCMRVAARQA